MPSPDLNPKIQAVAWNSDRCVLLDQTKLPFVETYISCSDYEQVVEAIKSLKVRGAPAIGIAGAYAVVLACRQSQALPHSEQLEFIEHALGKIRNARPTAVNLEWAVAQMQRVTQEYIGKKTLVEKSAQRAVEIHDADIRANRTMARFGGELLNDGCRILTHCNAGELATGGIGTALGVIYQAHQEKKLQHVYVDETRPVLQGLRLTAWELKSHGVPFTAICDNMAGYLMSQGKVDAVIVGADRIAANGDVANKIGTYSLAVLAKYHGIPFYVVAPVSTFDLSLEEGSEIPIENRGIEELLGVLGRSDKIWDVPAINPAFDVTPHGLIAAIICEKGVIRRPNLESIQNLVS